ncbi:MAG TPA: DinB family protein [Stackebrandtia sp.]|jgi:uncharacterized damage-inducible protein DinB|uniref:DinB family protein n=1 Tax=Stackebrandtia sp. TaxID=2023065 RepID=UPI002D71C6E9|nr:DinB family protein [Stackebrandtia sp.]HZE39611.1 DinB family protein [Stackebrandtia sp.]
MSEPRGDVRPPSIIGDEKATLLAFLRYLRESVIAKLDGLTEEQARTPGVESGTSLLWIVKHLPLGELNWIEWAYRGTADEPWDSFPPVTDADTVCGVVARYRDVSRRIDQIIADCTDLDAPGRRVANEGEPPPTMRWILVHTIEDTARHAGQADILRERIDGKVGR